MNIIPDKRLLFFFGAICFPFSLLAVAVPEYGTVAYGVIALFFITVILDGILSVGAFDNIEVVFPDIVRMSKGRLADFQIVIKSEKADNREVKVGIAFPESVFSEEYEFSVPVLYPENGTFAWPVVGLKQGQYILDKCYLEKKSVFGFWLQRAARAIHCEFRIYPDLFSEQKALAAIFKNNGMGQHIQKFVGKGREFEKLREYVPGDSYEDIHWKATAKRGVPVSKVYQVERTQDIYLMIDASRMSARNAGIYNRGVLHDEKRGGGGNGPAFSGDTILDRYITASLTLGLAAEKQGDNFGVGIFSDHVSRFMKAKSGKVHFNACRDMMYTVSPHRVSPDYSEFFTFLGTRIRKRSLMIVLTSLDDPVLSENFLENVSMLSRRHLVLVCMLKPAIANPLFASENVASVNDIYQNLAGHSLWSTLRETERNLYRHGIGFCLLRNDQMSLQLISRYVDIKQRQLI